MIPDYVGMSPASLIRKMLQVDPLKRATMKDIKLVDGYGSDGNDDHDEMMVLSMYLFLYS